MAPEPNLQTTTTEIANSAPHIWPYVWTILLSAWGGIVNYIDETEKQKKPWNWRELLFDVVTSSFAGVLTYLFCQAANIHGPMAAVLIGVSGHMGTRALASFQNLYRRILGDKQDGQ